MKIVKRKVTKFIRPFLQGNLSEKKLLARAVLLCVLLENLGMRNNAVQTRGSARVFREEFACPHIYSLYLSAAQVPLSVHILNFHLTESNE